MGRPQIQKSVLMAALLLTVLLNMLLWTYSNPLQPRWANLPPAPTREKLMLSYLDDPQFAYRVSGVMLQNFGNTSGKGVVPLKDYNFDRLGKWFNVLDLIEPHSNYVPFVAAYYFGATQNPKQLTPVIAYLRKVGQRDEKEKWRWLVQAMFMAKHRQKDINLALEIAQDLDRAYKPGMPLWTRQMRALISAEMGDKEAAYKIFMALLSTDADKLHPNEVNYMRDQICNKILEPNVSARHPLCQDPIP